VGNKAIKISLLFKVILLTPLMEMGYC